MIRQRSRGTIKPAAVVGQYWQDSTPTGWVAGSSYYGVQVGDSQSFYDQVTPGWWKRAGMSAKAKKKLPFVFNPMTSISLATTCQGSGLVLQSNMLIGTTGRYSQWKVVGDCFSAGLYHWFKGVPEASDIYTSTQIEALVAEVCTDLKANIRAGNAALGETLAQYSQIPDLVKDPIKGFNNVTKTFMSGSDQGRNALDGLKKAGRRYKVIIDQISSSYLWWRYGLKPFASDMNEVLKAIKATHDTDDFVTRSKGSLTSTREDSLAFNFGNATINLKRVTVETVTVRAMSIDRFRASLTSDLGLLPDQIPITAWNLLPGSFIVDWFINVGSFINAMVPRLGLVHLGGCYTVERVKVTTVQAVDTIANDSGGYQWVVLTPCTGTASKITRTKTRYTSIPDPTFMVKSDFRFTVPTRVADALALMNSYAQSMKGSKIISMFLRH